MDSDTDRSVYFQGSSTNSMHKLKRQLSKTKDSSDKKVKLENMSTSNGIVSPLGGGLERLKDDFFNTGCEQLAKRLLGKILVRSVGDAVLKGRIVETECYPGGEDRASHSYNGKMTPRNKAMFMKPGTIYVYLTYGMYHCFNISCEGDGAAVLIRALEPLEGIDRIRTNRLKFQGRKNQSTDVKERQIKQTDLCNGPGKLTVAFEIDVTANEKDICSWQGLYIETDGEVIDPNRIIASRRIGIDSHGEPWTSKPWRFYVYQNRCVSKIDRLKEKEILQSAEQT